MNQIGAKQTYLSGRRRQFFETLSLRCCQRSRRTRLRPIVCRCSSIRCSRNLGDDESRTSGRDLDRLALERARRSESNFPSLTRSAPRSDPALAWSTPSIEALAMFHQGALVQLDVVAEGTNEGPAQVCQMKKVEVIALEPPAL